MYNIVLCRVNFTLEELAPAVPAYSYFRKCLDKSYKFNGKCFSFEATQLETDDISLCSSYYRVKEMVKLLRL